MSTNGATIPGESSQLELPPFSLDVQAMDLGPGIKAVGLELVETENREPVRGPQAAAIWLDVDRVKLGHDFSNGSRKMLIDFVGRKTMFPGSYGHMGMSGSEIIVDRVISIKKID